MQQGVQNGVSLALAAMLFYGAGYAVGRERVRQSDPQAVYQQVNRESFGGDLPDIPVKWSYLRDEYGVMNLYSDGSADIEIDRESVTSEKQLVKTMRHEACHVETRAVVEATGQDIHGEAFQNCMKRFE